MRSYFLAVVFTFSCLLFSHSEATELEPWHKSIYSVDFNSSCLLQQFNRLDTSCRSIKRHEFDAFYHFSVLGVCNEKITTELELMTSNTRYKSIGLNAFRITGRYFWLDDVIGDPVSLVTGLTLSKIFKASKRNLAIFDHGGVSGEAHISIGKEVSCEQFWTSRAWCVLGLGVADVGSPWLRANFIWEGNWWNIHQLKMFADTIWGFGGKRLHIHPFHGYGSLNYQAIDVGLRYGYILPSNIFLSAGYGYRVYGRNCPIHVNFLKFEINYPICL